MRKIAVFTGTRAEYGLLYWLLKSLENDTNVNLQLFVGGTHLSHEFGHTIDHIIKDGFEITAKLDFISSADSHVAIAQSLALAITTTAQAIEDHQPDIIIILGDRYEALGVAQAALISQIPIAHIHGGEVTEGAFDDAIRHSLTKLSHLHFTSTECYRQRVIQLGENPEHVFNVGAPGIDSIAKYKLLTREALCKYFDNKLTQSFFVVTYHPVTLCVDGAIEAFKNMLKVLEKFDTYQMIISYPNADTFGGEIIELLKSFQHRLYNRVFLVKSMGHLRYLSAMKHASAVIGNSSSGIIEAPSLCIPTVNIGDRQKGRIASDSVLHCGESESAIEDAIQYALSTQFNNKLKKIANPYGNGGASAKIAAKLNETCFDELIQKRFYSVTHSKN